MVSRSMYLTDQHMQIIELTRMAIAVNAGESGGACSQFMKLWQVPTLAAIPNSTNNASHRNSAGLPHTLRGKDASCSGGLFARTVMVPPTSISPKTGDGNSGR